MRISGITWSILRSGHGLSASTPGRVFSLLPAKLMTGMSLASAKDITARRGEHRPVTAATSTTARSPQVMAAIRVGRSGPDRPRVRPDHAIADKGYSSRAIRSQLARRGIGHTVPERADQQAGRSRRGSRGGRPRCSPSSSTTAQPRRTLLQPAHAVPRRRDRYDKAATSHQATVTIAALLQRL